MRSGVLLRVFFYGLSTFSALCFFSYGFASDAREDRKVIVGAYVNNIHNLDLRTHSYGLDFYLWFRWKNPRIDPSKTLEIMNPFELWAITVRSSTEKPVRLPGGEFYQVLRIEGRFNRKFDLSQYPFDRQTLTIEVEDNRHDAHEIEYVPDSDTVRLNPSLALPGFILGEPSLNILAARHPTRFGDPRENASAMDFSRLSIQIPVIRPAFTYALKFMLPILCVVFCTALMFFFNPSFVDARVGIGITALLTIVALQITLNEDLPEVDYLVLIDKIYLSAYLYVIASLSVVVKTTWLLEKGNKNLQKAVQSDRISLAAFTLAFLLSAAILIIAAL